MCDSNEFVLSLKLEEYKWIEAVLFTFVSCLINLYNQPHSEYIQDYMYITHVVFCNIVIEDHVEKAIKIQTRCRILNGSSISYQFAIIVIAFHIDEGLLSVGGQIDLMAS